MLLKAFHTAAMLFKLQHVTSWTVKKKVGLTCQSFWPEGRVISLAASGATSALLDIQVLVVQL